MNNHVGQSSPTLSSVTEKLPSTVSESAVALGPWRVLVLTPDLPLAGNVLFPEQVHGGNIARASELARGKLEVDGVLVDEPGVMAGILSADCIPLVVTSDARALILHVGRKGLVRGLLDNALTYLDPADIDHLYVGPHICEYHLGFTEEDALLRQFRYRYPTAVHFHRGLEYVSLRKALLSTLASWSVHRDKIHEDGRCTFEHPELPSYRRQGADYPAGDFPRLRTVLWRLAS